MYFPATASKPMKIVDIAINDIRDTEKKALILYTGYKEMYIPISPDHGPSDYSFGILR